MIKEQLATAIMHALTQLNGTGKIKNVPTRVQIDMTRDKQYGDFACNVALLLAKAEQLKARDLAQLIISALPPLEWIAKVEVAGPGFINIFLKARALDAIIARILSERENFGRKNLGQGKSVLIEFVSSNPTGPLHVGHGRHAVVGDVVSNLLAAVGFKPYKEYYVNDAGRQMDIVTVSIWVRYLNLMQVDFPFPANGYQGSYINEIASAMYQQTGKQFLIAKDKILANLPLDEPAGGDKEQYIDALIQQAKALLGENYAVLLEFGLTAILNDMRNDLAEFGVQFDHWFSERALVTETLAARIFDNLLNKQLAYKQANALWFRSSQFGDAKDRVLVKANGERTYFANDMIYHLNKFERGFAEAIDIFGADHHGYVPRMKAAMQAHGIDPKRLNYILLQFVSLFRHGEPVKMSTRGGAFVTLRELREEVGNDAARYFYSLRKCEQHIDFDLDLAKAKSNENPVYYVQYAHARICSVFRQAVEKQFSMENGLQNLSLLTSEHEQNLLMILQQYPECIANAAQAREPQVLTNYLRELAAHFHAYYNAQQFIVADDALRNARLVLIKSIQQVLQNGFQLLGIFAPEKM